MKPDNPAFNWITQAVQPQSAMRSKRDIRSQAYTDKMKRLHEAEEDRKEIRAALINEVWD